MRFYYLIAEKGARRLCVKYNARWREEAVDYLLDRGYRLRATSEYHWHSRVDEVGHKLTCYQLDDSVNVFDPENP